MLDFSLLFPHSFSSFLLEGVVPLIHLEHIQERIKKEGASSELLSILGEEVIGLILGGELIYGGHILLLP